MQQIRKIIFATFLVIMLTFLIVNYDQIIHAQSQVTLSLSPSTVAVASLTDTFTLNYTISGVTNLWGWNANITWDPQFIQMSSATQEGDFLTQSGHQTEFVTVYNKTTSSLKGPVADVGLDSLGQSGSGTLAVFTFQVLKPVVDTIIKINATNLFSNTPTGGSVPEFTNPVSPYPALTTATASISYVPSSGVPVPDSGGNQTVNQFTNVIFNASKTLPQDPSQNYTWTFFDNASRTLTGVIANYTFDLPGIFPVTLTVSNANGTSTAIVGITVKDITPPVPIITIEGYPSGQNLPVNQYVHFDGNQSYDPYNLTVHANWDFGDGSTYNPMPNESHLFTSAGTYVVTLTVTSTAGLKATATKTVTVGVGAAATANPNQTTSPAHSPTGTSNLSFNLPSTVLWTLIFVTILVLGGSVFWLRKRV